MVGQPGPGNTENLSRLVADHEDLGPEMSSMARVRRSNA
jgi:hypothetical protein